MARFEQERSELTQTIEQVENDKQQFEEEKEEAVADAEMHQDTVENMATTLSRWQHYADKLTKQLVDVGAEPLSWAAFQGVRLEIFLVLIAQRTYARFTLALCSQLDTNLAPSSAACQLRVLEPLVRHPFFCWHLTLHSPLPFFASDLSGKMLFHCLL
eukprot:COSAG02_NODE_3590_length_6517_cov_2.757401_3_plen_158_part_00